MATPLTPFDGAPVAVGAPRAATSAFDPRRLVRWGYLARMAVASALLVAAVLVWQQAAGWATLVATLAFAGTVIATAASALWSEVRRRPLGRTFFYLQTLFDLLLVTAAVHVTGGGDSQFAGLYILVIAAAAVFLPVGGALLVALLGCVLYFADVFAIYDTTPTLGLLLQLAVFGAVALGSAYIGERLRVAGASTAELAAELRKARLEAADILANIRSGIVTVDERGRLLYANPTAGELLGPDVVDIGVDGGPMWERLRPIAPSLADALRRAALERVRTTRAEGVVTRDGREFPVGVTTAVHELAGHPGHFTATAIFQDIADQKRLDALAMRAQRLEAVAELSASLAHEIRNPLASIRSAVEQLARLPAGDDDAPVLSGLIVREVDRLSRLLSEFLDFSRVRVTISEPVDIAAVAREAAGLAGAHPDRRAGVRVSAIVPAQPLLVQGDPDLLHRALFNLALNAVQAAPPDSDVTIEAAAAGPDVLPAGLPFYEGAVVVRVTDRGAGVPEEVRGHLFEPFTSTKPGGSGLGLAVVHRAIEAHRGVVFADEPAEGGARFVVILPVDGHAGDADASVDAAAFRGSTVLLADA